MDDLPSAVGSVLLTRSGHREGEGGLRLLMPLDGPRETQRGARGRDVLG